MSKPGMSRSKASISSSSSSGFLFVRSSSSPSSAAAPDGVSSGNNFSPSPLPKSRAAALSAARTASMKSQLASGAGHVATFEGSATSYRESVSAE